MRAFMECVPNFSEGRRKEIVEEIVAVMAEVDGVRIIGCEMDADHNRSVITLLGVPDGIGKAAFRGVEKAVELIDMRKHRGEHPRMGAADVVPFVPIRGVEMKDCVEMSRRVGRKIGDELGVPVFLYGEAATRPERVNLANVRKGEFEGLAEEIGKNPDREPDFGPARIHPTAGAVAVGARIPLIAYNVNLKTSDVKIAKEIAKRVRESSGGLPAVRALGVFLADKGVAQVTMNLLDYRKTSLKDVFDAVRKEAIFAGTDVLESELVGLIPQAAIADIRPEDVLLSGFDESKIIETHLW